MKRRTHLEYEDHLTIDSVDTVKLAKKYGTPLYVTSAAAIKKQYRRLYKTLSSHYEKIRIYYACKANTNLAILNLLRKEGCWIDAVSKGEIFSALKAGFPPEKIMFTGTSVSNEELRYALEKGVTINIDSLSELERLIKLGTAPISIRVNPGIGAGHHEYVVTGGENSKFGIWRDSVKEAYRKGKKVGLTILGIHMHIGSGVLKVDKFIPPVARLLKIAGEIAQSLDISFEFIDIGGGLGVPYKPDDKPLDLQKFSQTIASLFKKSISKYNLGEPFLALEPGRFFVAESTILLTKVHNIKKNPAKTFVGVDAGFNTFQRPVMYGSYHEIVNASYPSTENPTLVDVAGPLCDSGDLLGKNRKLEVEEGDILAILDTGAYGFSMASRYNSRPLPTEVMIVNGHPNVIRKRETLKDLIKKREEVS
ncbi:MAG: diaminopimelate decarboxylase [Candidatus Korarchaeota archaeon]|nr:diaminopimelate decarboxylase [Candidatus Korarchaeota archaeon]NIU85031.1 diaminopimelate decarboxylase [Candidatus Thorarchaeota archaeon]NIW15056.1 diaminopimelate decarboxylase [Candidatus Thorarchaeota archaeon]NIW53066.1 diaminopimelate decarboxylase [Candidatus Korarchaeota archaeon]